MTCCRCFAAGRFLVYLTTAVVFALAMFCFASSVPAAMRQRERSRCKRRALTVSTWNTPMGSGAAQHRRFGRGHQYSNAGQNPAIERTRVAGHQETQPGVRRASLALRPSVGSEGSPGQVDKALRTFHKNLSVKPIGGTRLIEIDYLSPDPALAAAVVNQMVQELVDYSFETRYKATEAASESLSKQLADLRIRSESLQAQVAQMQRASGIYSIGTTDANGRQQGIRPYWISSRGPPQR